MYAIIRAGGHQEKVSVGDQFDLDRVEGEPGSTVSFPALLLVDGDQVTSDPQALSGVSVSAEILGHSKGEKIRVLRYKNKTGYRRRQGHRRALTTVRVTAIDGGE